MAAGDRNAAWSQRHTHTQAQRLSHTSSSSSSWEKCCLTGFVGGAWGEEAAKEGGFKSSRDLSPPCGETSAFNVSELEV